MKAAALVEPCQFELVERPLPRIDADGVLIQVKTSGICGTDLHIYQGHRPDIQLPRVMGHEFAGLVEEVGSAVTSVQVGDHVVVDPVLSCGECYACRAGRNNICTTVKCLGCQVDGSFQEYIAMKAGNVYPIDPKISWEHAALAEPFAIAAQVLERGNPQPGEKVAILGAGTIGLCVLQVYQLQGVEVFITDVIESRLQKARALGAAAAVNPTSENLFDAAADFTGGQGFDLVVEAVGHKDRLDEALQMLTRGGRIVVLGLDKAQTNLTEMNFVRTEIDIRGSVLNRHKFPQVVQWIEKGQVAPQELITEVYPFSEIAQAFSRKLEAPQDSLKTLFQF